ncbi:XrtA-associated tyrosine autokinase [Ectothiorhodospira shaposhnikovii]|uniref:XrtA-associated tyrosine autokinase n=1 Tax=Ectothiorhodospira shaposhnikovii TaxID=1054 RepID=UPI001EE96A69|nr:XrtA-associated tyrosine autokinase [Ectothiorhodospira shaposhnikovii]MCG5512109.1 XrtA-associated tyrosine autokinase [Ectothiorhodospira shaposhnikovii]
MSDKQTDLSLIEKAVRRLEAGPETRDLPRAEPEARAPAITTAVSRKTTDDQRETPSVSAPMPPFDTLPDIPPPPPDVDPASDRYVALNLAHLREQGFITANSERNHVSEEFRMIKRPLLANAFGRGAELVDQGNLIMVTSAKSGEGKTFTAINLAMSIAMEMDKTVLLVDADVGRARVHHVLGTPQGPGLIDLLLDKDLDVGDVIIKTNVPKLRVIPMGRYHPHSNELLASEDMLRLTRELAERYPDRVVIFDSPPLLLTSESVVVAGLVGQIVFVVESSRTLQGTVKDALAMLDTSKPIGLVLNKVRRTLGNYGYGYGYGYGYHGKSDTAKETPA